MKAKQIELLAPIELQLLVELVNQGNFRGNQAPLVTSVITKLKRAKDIDLPEPESVDKGDEGASEE